jgi:hypothetical protein
VNIEIDIENFPGVFMKFQVFSRSAKFQGFSRFSRLLRTLPLGEAAWIGRYNRLFLICYQNRLPIAPNFIIRNRKTKPVQMIY